MKLLGYCLLCLFATRVQPKPQITKLFPVEGLTAYHKQLTNTTKHLDKFLGKLRATYNFVFRQPDNTSNVEKILAKNASNPDLQALKLIWADTIKTDNYASLKYPNNSLMDQVKSLSTLKNHESKTNSSSLQKTSSIEMKSTIKANESNVSPINSGEENFNKKKTLPDSDWFNDVQPLGQLELQDEDLDRKNEVEIVTPGTTLQLPSTVGRQLVEWLGSLLGLTYSIYSKLSGAVCGNEKVSQ